ncbi:Cyclic di-GMP phosphodiesterase response regulator RpfG [Hartmannibacter diazotrophicus]|uniref:Cyclic di-GMP phosphodiesterase response regulator RpfG n=2 Tax=Hartmannibacter diazotrophicus TaxID=1482074 RepID=A0A2C9D7S4_9HYPH|nr:Cyclic di-GMP phosphodiesterase response regulator RpfG [Hartmannibacter diazotrophicus]
MEVALATCFFFFLQNNFRDNTLSPLILYKFDIFFWKLIELRHFDLSNFEQLQGNNSRDAFHLNLLVWLVQISCVPILYFSEEPARELAVILGRSGLTVQLCSLDRLVNIPPASAYIVVEERGLDASRTWTERAGSKALGRTMVWGRNISGRDICDLQQYGIGYVCKAGPKIDAVLKILGTLDATSMMAAVRQREDAQHAAQSIFHNTIASFELFGSQETFNRDFYLGLGDDFASQIERTPLFHLIDAIARNQDTTIQHCSLVTTVAVAFGGALGLSAQENKRIFMAAFFHDIGKVAIPKSIIDKPSRLTTEEMRLMRTHASVGYDMLSRFPETAGEIADVALHHHEMLDGSGYPQGLKGSEISDLIRIITICDIFSALIERRAYKPPMPAEEAFAILKSMADDGKLDPDLVALFGPLAEAISFPGSRMEPSSLPTKHYPVAARA